MRSDLRRSRRRRRRLAAFALVGAAIVVGGLAFRDASAARRDLLLARGVVDGIERDITDKPVTVTVDRVGRAGVLASRAYRRASSPPMRVVGFVPVLGRTARGARSLAGSASTAIASVLSTLENLPRGFTDADGTLRLGLTSGSVDRAAWDELRRLVARSHTFAERARAQALEAPATWVPGALADARATLIDAATRLERTMRSGLGATALAPRMLGAHGKRTYLVVFQNLAEARGTGGLVGGFALVRADAGRITLEAVAPNTDLVTPKQPVPMPEWYRARYDRFGARRHWSNVNVEPDLRVTGPLIANLFEQTNGARVDGVVLLDPYALAEMLRATGPVQGPGGVELTAETIAKLTMHDAYRMFPAARSTERKAFFADAFRRIFERVLDASNDRALGEALAASANGEHVQAWSRDAVEQNALEALDVAGRVTDRAPQFVSVVVQNAAANKVDYYLRRAIDLRVETFETGVLRATMTVTLRNEVPVAERTVFPYVPDPPVRDVGPGANKTYLSVYLPANAEPDEMRIDGEPATYESEVSPSARILSRFVVVEPGGTLTVRLQWIARRAVRDGELRLSIPKQPTVAPDDVRVSVSAPGGWRWVEPRAAGRVVERAYRADGAVDVRFLMRRSLWHRLTGPFR